MKKKNKIPRCPLCHADFDRKFLPSRKEKAEAAFFKTMNRMPETPEETDLIHSMAWAFMCHFCKIAIMCNDPFVGRWEEAYAKGEKVFCPSCGTEMRCFCTSTGYMLFQCPVKKCRSRMELSAPDRSKEPVASLFDEHGNPLSLPNIPNPVSTPDAPALTPVMGDGSDPSLPKETLIQ